MAKWPLGRCTGDPENDGIFLHDQYGRLAFADRNKYVADSDFVSVPVAGMLDPAYLAERAALITETDMGTAQPGSPPDALVF